MVDRELAALERSRAALTAIQAVQNAGGAAYYRSLDLLDGASVAAVVKEIADRHGRIDVLVHAAGLEISHMLPDKKPAEFDLVFDVKSDGWYNLMSGIGRMPVGAAVVFSSVAGRFGNAGQTDYSAANDLLCKCISHLRTARPETRGLAIDWTAWSGIGMAARGSIPTVMKQAGIDMLAPEAGIPIVRRELAAGTMGELVIGQKLGILLKEFDPKGGLDTSPGGPLEPVLRRRGVMTGGIAAMGIYDGLMVQTTLDPAEQPFLHDHQISGTPVLPGVMGIEAMAEAAGLLYPDRRVAAAEAVNFLTPFKFYRNQRRTLTVRAVFYPDGDDIAAECRLIGSRTLHGQTEAEVTTHFTGRVRLTAAPAEAEREIVDPRPGAAPKVGAAEIYRVFFHGPAYQVIDSAWRSGDRVIGLFKKELPADRVPAEPPLAALPRLVELCFQTGSLAALGRHGRLGLPHSVRDVRFLSGPDDAADAIFYAIAVPNPDGTYDARVVDDKGRVYVDLRGYRTMDLPDPVPADLVDPIRRALGV
jgi:hypothetical protein